MNVATQQSVDTSAPFDERIKFLKYCAERYEHYGDSPLSDAEYDKEYYALQDIDPTDPFFTEVGGSIDHVYGALQKHQIIMGSLSKCLNPKAFKEWLLKSHKAHAGNSFSLEHKIDGASLSLLYKGGKLVEALTRGDGTTGTIVTNNAIHIKGVRTRIAHLGEVEIRGECFKNSRDFDRDWKPKGYANPRNFAAGSLTQKDPEITKERGLEFIAYEVKREDFDTEKNKMKFLVRQGFQTLAPSTKFTKTGNSLEKVADAVKVYMSEIDRSKLPYRIDGIVVKINNIAIADSMGTTDGGRKPKANVAVKFPPEEQETVLKAIEVNVGRTGQLTPVGILEPVNIDGSTVQRVSLHNFGALKTNTDLCLGSRIIVTKQGDIIPHVKKVLKKGDKAVTFPTVCPSCGEPVKWDKTSVNLVCGNTSCTAQLNTRIEHWLKVLGVKGIGSSTIASLTDPEVLKWEGRPIIRTLPEMYYMLDNDRASDHPFRKYQYLKDHFGEKAFANIVKAVKSVSEVPLDQFIKALGIGQIGRMASEITAIAPTVNDIDQLTVQEVLKVEGFAETKATSFLNGWKAQRKEIRQLLRYIKLVQPKKASDKLVGKKFCFTGKFTVKRTELEELVKQNGGKTASVGKETILVWDGEMMGSKLDKAKKLKASIIDEDAFRKMLD